MSPWRALTRRELRGWLLYPGHYVMAAAFLAASGLGFWLLALTGAGHGVLTSELTFGGTVFWLSVTALAALASTRPLSEERERGTIELLLTAPVRERDVVAAVYTGALAWLIVICIPAVAAPWLLLLLAPGWTGVDAGAWMAGCAGLGCALAWLTAVGVLASAVFRRQTTAATVTFLAGLIVLFGGALADWVGTRGLVARAAVALHMVHAGGFADGFLDARAVTFAAVVTAWCLAATVKILEWSRGRPAGGRLNGLLTLVLAVVLGAMILTVSHRHPQRWDWSASRSRPVSERTAQVLGALTQPVHVTLVGQSDDPLTAAWRVLQRYPLASRRVTVEWIDPDRDLEKTRELARRYGVRESGVAVVQGPERHRVVGLRGAVAEGDERGAAGRRTATAGRLDAALASAIYAVTHQAVAGVYFLTGHGERGADDRGDYTGYGEIADRVRAMQADVRSVALDPRTVLSNDCAVLVIAGPSMPFSAMELARLREFVQRGGRLMMLLDSGTDTGLERLAAEWGIVAGSSRVFDPAGGAAVPLVPARSAAAGMGEVQVLQYARHPITDGLAGLVATFHLPRPVEAAAASTGGTGSLTDQADRPRVTVFALSSPASWLESDLTQIPAEFDEGFDRRGPIGLAACVEKGAASAVSVGIRSTRLVVFGDSQFAANRCLAGANARLFLNAMDWLLDEGGLAESAEATRGQFDLQLGYRERRLAFILIVTGPPLLALLTGAWVMLLRRDRRPAQSRGATEGAR